MDGWSFSWLSALLCFFFVGSGVSFRLILFTYVHTSICCFFILIIVLVDVMVGFVALLLSLLFLVFFFGFWYRVIHPHNGTLMV